MNAPRSKLARRLRIYLDILLGVTAIVAVVFAVWLVVSPLIMRDGERSEVAIQVAIGESSIFPVLPVDVKSKDLHTIQDATLVKSRGELRFETANRWLHLLSNGSLLVGLVIVVFVLYLLRSILKSVSEGSPFRTDNVFRLRFIGVAILAAAMIQPFVEYRMATYVLSQVTSTDPVMSAPLTIPADPIFAGLLVLLLAQIWKYGVELETESELTV